MFDDTIHSFINLDSDLHNTEKKRIDALNNYNILNTINENEFDRLTRLAAIICETPLSSVTLVNENNLVLKSGVGLEQRHLQRDNSFSHYVIKNTEFFEVEDALKDERFQDYEYVKGPPQIRFYAGYPLIDPNGYALGTLCVLDFKPRKLNEMQKQALITLAEEVLSQILYKKEKAEKKQFEELFIRSIDMVCLAGFDGYFKKINPAFNITLGWSIQELLEKPFIHYVHPDDKENTIKEMNNLSKGIRTTQFTNRYLTKSGEFKILSWVANPDQAARAIYAIARDRTDFYRTKAELELAENKFRDVFENSPDAIFIEDATGKILDVNAAAITLQGISKEELIGSNFRKLVPRNNYAKLLSDYKKLFFGLVKTIESTLWSPLHGEIPIEISGKKFTYGGSPALLLLVRDIRERKKLEKDRAEALLEKTSLREEQIKLSIKVQEDERNRIAADMHDEVGAGLSRISILGQVIKKKYDDPEIVSSNIDKILLSSHLVQKNIGEIIWAINPKNDTLNNLLSYINYYASEFLETSSIRAKITLPVSFQSIKISGKARRNIFLVVKEALHNIVKYAKATNVILDLKIEENVLSVFISDNGKGFELDDVSSFSNGILNMKKRTLDIGGIINIESGKLSGTLVFLYVPVSAIVTE